MQQFPEDDLRKKLDLFFIGIELRLLFIKSRRAKRGRGQRPKSPIYTCVQKFELIKGVGLSGL